MIPQDNFTPYGYLDNPFHSWKLHPSGVLRSLPPLGMGWHMPNFGSYARNQFQYTAHLTIGLNINDLLLVTPEDVVQAGCQISSPVHTKHCFAYRCFLAAYNLTLTLTYTLVHEHALGCEVTLSTGATEPLEVTCYLLHVHTHNPLTSRLWEHGLYALSQPEQGYAMLGLASEGDVFTHGAQLVQGQAGRWEPSRLLKSLADVGPWIKGEPVSSPSITQREAETGFQQRVLVLPYTLELEKESAVTFHAVLARGVSQDQSLEHWQRGLADFSQVYQLHQQKDAAFWEAAPQLAGDWPDHWRRGWIYDLETLRMVVREPAGVLPSAWSGMQIQAPRTVLAEAGMDMLSLSYADPERAAQVLLDTFATAPHANLPCMREDGSYNMVSDDGQICGTAPEWGYPVWCCHQLWLRSGDSDWLRRLYPGVAAYLRWWLTHRRDQEGWAIYACSWESGQDVSSRFGPQQTGGTRIQHVRPVDLQASLALSATLLAEWATALDAAWSEREQDNPYPAEKAFWQGIAQECTEKTQHLWHDGWFRDYDSVRHLWSSERDIMHLAPLFCGLATSEQLEQIRPILRHPPAHSSHWAPLSWPPVVLTLIGATVQAGMHEEATALATRFLNASYQSTDRRSLDEDGGLPGVTREYLRTRGEEDGSPIYVNAGIEGYGWGALGIHLLLSIVFGLQPVQHDTLCLCPLFPEELRLVGACYRIPSLPWGQSILALQCRVRDAQRYAMHLQLTSRSPHQQEAPSYQCTWEAQWGEGYLVHLPTLQITPLKR